MFVCALEFEELLERIRSGDETAMAEMVEKYGTSMRRAAHFLIGAPLRSHLDSVDLVQSINIILLKAMRQNKLDISSPEKLMALATALLRRRVARHWRRLKGELELTANGKASPQYSMLPGQALEVREMLAGLEEVDRRLVTLRLWGHSTADAARELDMDPAVLRVRLGRLRKRLRDQGVFKEYF